MNAFSKYRKLFFTVAALSLSVLILTRCIDRQGDKPVDEEVTLAPGFAGSASCASCHSDIFAAHRSTGHFLTSTPAKDSFIRGSFSKGENEYAFNDHVKMVMEKRPEGFFQAAYVNGEKNREERFDLVVGSGAKGQSYLHWNENELVQLPITYFTATSQWCNSPGYPGRLVFNRPITSRCLECHTTYAETLDHSTPGKELFRKESLLLGVDCEKCHGPAKNHVRFHQEGGDSIGSRLLNLAMLSRQQKLDMCALCHGGKLNKTKPSFSFSPGQRLADFFTWDTISGPPDDIDVHGNQYGMLSTSKCFTASEMTCGSCHAPHQNERGKLEVFSQRCVNCHTSAHVAECGMKGRLGESIKSNCIDCHMPRQPSRAIAVYLPGSTSATAAMLRSHVIKVYSEESEKHLQSFKNKNQGNLK